MDRKRKGIFAGVLAVVVMAAGAVYAFIKSRKG